MRSIISAILVCIFCNAASASTIVTVQDQDYLVETVAGSFVDNSDLLESQVWWGDNVLAREFADLVGSELGYPLYDGVYSPIFTVTSYTSSETGLTNSSGWVTYFGDGRLVGAGREVSESTFYAVATAVPIPPTIWLFGSALAGLGWLRRKQNA